MKQVTHSPLWWNGQLKYRIFIIVNEVTFKYPKCRSFLQTQQENVACQKRVTCSACRNSIKVIDSVHLISCLRVQKLLAPKAMTRVHAGRKKGYTMIDSITHWGLTKMADTSYATFSNVFPWKKSLVLFNFQGKLFLRAQLTISQSWLR